jgi:hypothetical protein
MKALIDGLQRIRPVPPEDKQRFWDNDADCTECNGCKKKFGIIVRKHHCRMCGRCDLTSLRTFPIGAKIHYCIARMLVPLNRVCLAIVTPCATVPLWEGRHQRLDQSRALKHLRALQNSL